LSNKENPSTIDRTINLCQALNLPYEPVKLHKYQPPWDLPNLIDTTFRAHKKHTTPPETYRKLYEHTKDNHKTHKFIFTDGSKMNSTIAYAITTDTYIIKYGILPPYSSVLSAEIIAILVAIDQVKSTRGKFMICSDSLSAIDAIRNTNNDNYCRSFHPKSSRLDQIKIIRLRLGHTKLTHEHYFNQNQTSPCPFCQGDNNIPHLLNSCPSLLPTKLSIFKNTNPINLLNELNPDNLEKILLFLKATNLYHKI